MAVSEDTRTFLVGPAGNVVQPLNEEEAVKFRHMGFEPASETQISREAVRAQFDKWYNAPVAGAVGVMEGIPGATSALMGVLPEGMQQNVAGQMQGLADAFPTTTLGGNIAGTVGTAVLGGEALAGAAAMTGAVPGTAWQAAARLGSAAVRGGIENAAMGVGYRADANALAHAMDPAGQEKLHSALGADTLTDFAIGAAVAGAAGPLGQAFKKVGKALDLFGDRNMLEAAVGAENMASLVEQGKATKVGQFMKDRGLFGVKPTVARVKTAKMLAELGPQFNKIKEAASVPLSVDDAQSMFQNLHENLGGIELPELQKMQRRVRVLADTEEFDKLARERTVTDARVPVVSGESEVVEEGTDVQWPWPPGYVEETAVNGPPTKVKLSPFEEETKVKSQRIPAEYADTKVQEMDPTRISPPPSGMSSPPNNITVGRLHQLRDSIDGMIDWEDVAAPRNAKLNSARETVDNYLRRLLDQNDAVTGGALAGKWRAVNEQYNMASLVNSYLKTRGAQAAGDNWWQKPAMLAGGAALAALGAGHVAGDIKKGVAVAGALYAAYKTGKVGYIAQKLSGVFNQVGGRMVDAVEHGMYGLGPWTYGEEPANATNYELKMNQTRYVAGRSEEAVANMSKALEAGGYPAEFVDSIVQRQVAISTYLAQFAPKSPFSGNLAPYPWTPSEEARDKWAELYNTAHDVSHALADPTPEKIAIAQTFYPAILDAARQATIAVLSTTPDVPMETRIWASRLLGQPVEPLLQPINYMILSSARQAVEQEQAAAAQAPASGQGDSDMVKNEMTATERLQNR
jgi:hypothetical protein